MLLRSQASSAKAVEAAEAAEAAKPAKPAKPAEPGDWSTNFVSNTLSLVSKVELTCATGDYSRRMATGHIPG